MKAVILFSGGKDSALAAILLSKFFEIELVNFSFGMLDNWKKAEKAAKELNFPFRKFDLDKKILEEASKMVINEGFPANGIKHIHCQALQEMAKGSKIIADGVRRDDRVPVLSLSEIRHLEDKFDVHFIQPLMGYSRRTINLLIDKFLIIKEYKSGDSLGAEYEFELRKYIQEQYGPEKIKEVFPQEHSQSIVVSLKG